MWITFLGACLTPCYGMGMENDQEQQHSAGDDSERQAAADTPGMARPGATEGIESEKQRMLTTQEALAIFVQSGIPRSKRSVERYCVFGKLDCKWDADENRYYINKGSIERLAGEIRQIQSRHKQKPTPFSRGVTTPGNGAADTPGMPRPGATDQKPKEDSRTSGTMGPWNLTEKTMEGLLAQLDAKDSQIKAKDNQIEQLHVLIKQAQEKIPQLQPGQGTQRPEDQEQPSAAGGND